jgi:O-antigen/teichoic acid export membrane protein
MSVRPSRFASLQRVKLLVDLAVLSGGQLASKVVGFIAFAYLARVLGPRDYGSVEYAVGLAGFWAMIIGFGLGPVGVRELARSDDRLRALTGNIPLARLLIVAVAMPSMAAAAWFSEQGAQAQTLVWIFTLSLLPTPWLLDWLLQARDMMGRASLAQLLRMVFFALGVVVFVRSSDDLLWVGGVEVGAVALTALYYLWIQHRHVIPLHLGASWREIQALFREGLGVGGAQVVGAVNLYGPLLLVANLSVAEETAWFGASHRVVASLSTFSMLYHFNLYPVLARRVLDLQEQLDTVMQASTRVVAWISIGGTLLLTLLRTELVDAVYGHEFRGAATTFGILVWFLPPTLISGHARWMMVAANGQRHVLIAQVVGAVVALGLGVPLVQAWQSEGAALAMLLGSLAVWASAQVSARFFVKPAKGTLSVILPALWALALGAAASHVDVGLNPWLLAALVGVAYWGMAPLLDRSLLSDLRSLAAAKSDATRAPTPPDWR